MALGLVIGREKMEDIPTYIVTRITPYNIAFLS
jgi:hypothetical protein